MLEDLRSSGELNVHKGQSGLIDNFSRLGKHELPDLRKIEYHVRGIEVLASDPDASGSSPKPRG
jgi:hypothetical protein